MRKVSGEKNKSDARSLCDVTYDGRKLTRGLENILATVLSAASDYLVL
jgi:hypothetical protein